MECANFATADHPSSAQPASLRAGSVLNPAHSSAAAMLPQYHHQSSSYRIITTAAGRVQAQDQGAPWRGDKASYRKPPFRRLLLRRRVLSTSQTLSEVREEGGIAAGEAARIEELNPEGRGNAANDRNSGRRQQCFEYHSPTSFGEK